MGRKVADLTGQKFGRLEVIRRAENDKYGKACWHCKCDCGRECIVRGADLRDGKTRSCGCLKKERATETHQTHGMVRSRIYRAWKDIKNRCLNPNCKNYESYGGRGISVYEPWIDSFVAFYEYVSQLEHYGEPGRSLDRVDNNSGYFPGNLRWADAKTQQRNKRNNRIVEYMSERMTVAEAAEKSGISVNVLYSRIHNGWSGDSLFAPNQGRIQKGAPKK